jgi:NTE family protein
MDISGMKLSRFGLLSNKKLGDLIDDNIGKANIDEATIPLSIITTNITNGEKTVLKKGSLSNAVMASACIPGVFTPVEMDNKLLVDGGIVENVPIHTVKEMGADYVIGVDLNAKHAYRKPKNIINVLMNSFHFTLRTAAKIQTKEADLLIKPDLSAFNMTSTKQIDDLIKQGYADAIKILNNWEI